MKKQMTYKTISLTVSVLVISFAIAFYALGWTEPTEDPPGGNVATPINVGDVEQNKKGMLSVGFEGIGLFSTAHDTYLAVIDGNVGIGTTEPEGSGLHIQGGWRQITLERTMAVDGTTNPAKWGFIIKENGDFKIKDVYPDPVLDEKDAFVIEQGTPSGTMKLMSNGDVLLVRDTGNVGIGTTSPSEKLGVAGNIVASGTICDSGGTNCIGAGGAGGSLWTESGGNVYRSSGNVGIGTTSPNSLLHLKTNSGSNAEINIQSGSSPYWAIYQDDSSNDLRFWNTNVPGDKNALTITDEGNVGIGTNAPGAKLEVSGVYPQIRLRSSSGVVEIGVSSSANVFYIKGSSTFSGINFRRNDLSDPDGNFDVMHLDMQNGYVGIGTVQPDTRLHVKGGSPVIMIEAVTANQAAHLYLKNTDDIWQVEGDGGGVGFRIEQAPDMDSSGTTRFRINPSTGHITMPGGYSTSSDGRFKENVEDITNALDIVVSMRAISYNWEESQNMSGNRRIGFIAQEMEKILPEVVITQELDGIKDYKSISYGFIVPVLAEAIKELKAEKDAEIKQLKAEIAALRKMVK